MARRTKKWCSFILSLSLSVSGIAAANPSIPALASQDIPGQQSENAAQDNPNFAQGDSLAAPESEDEPEDITAPGQNDAGKNGNPEAPGQSGTAQDDTEDGSNTEKGNNAAENSSNTTKESQAPMHKNQKFPSLTRMILNLTAPARSGRILHSRKNCCQAFRQTHRNRLRIQSMQKPLTLQKSKLMTPSGVPGKSNLSAK